MYIMLYVKKISIKLEKTKQNKNKRPQETMTYENDISTCNLLCYYVEEGIVNFDRRGCQSWKASEKG